MPAYSDDESPPSRDRRDRGPPRSSYDEPPEPDPRARRRPRRDQYDASDEDDSTKGREDRRGARPPRSQAEPDIPHPPIGEDRDDGDSPDSHSHSRTGPPRESRSRKPDGYDDAPPPRRRQPPPDDFDDAGPPSRKHSNGRGSYDDHNGDDNYAAARRRPRDGRSRNGDGDAMPPRPSRDRPAYDDTDDDRGLARRGSRRQRPDPYADAPPRYKTDGRDADRDADPRRRRDRPDRPRRYDDAADPDYGRPRRRRRDDRPRYEDGYGTDRPRRRPRDDDHERGYRTDGRDPRRDRRRADDRRDRDRDRDRDYRRDSARHHHDDEGRGSRRKSSKDGDMGLLEKGQKHWKTVEPIAKPLLAQLAKQYLG